MRSTSSCCSRRPPRCSVRRGRPTIRRPTPFSTCWRASAGRAGSRAWRSTGARGPRSGPPPIAASPSASRREGWGCSRRSRACRRCSGCWRGRWRRSRCCRPTGARYAEHAGRGSTPAFLSELAGARPRPRHRRPRRRARRVCRRNWTRPRRAGAGRCSPPSCARRPGARSAWTPPGPSIRARRSASSGSTRCWRWNCATRWAPPSADRCRRRCCSTIRRSTP